jgi:ribose transport system substrate-binding protein
MKSILGTILATTIGTAAALAAPAATAADKEIAVIVKTANSDFWQNVKKGANAAVGEMKGYTSTFQGGASDTDLAGQVALVENAVNRKVAAIVLAPSDPDALVPAIKKAWEAKIPVIVIDSAAGEAGTNY